MGKDFVIKALIVRRIYLSLLLCQLFTLLVFAGCQSSEDRILGYVELLKSTDVAARRSAALELAQMGPGAAIAVPQLTKLLYDPQWKVKNGAAHALNRIGTVEAVNALKEAVPYYVMSLSNNNDEVRWHAAEGLGYFGIHAMAAVPALIKVLDDPNEAVRNAATFSLQKMKR